jgi:hypothetical protein
LDPSKNSLFPSIVGERVVIKTVNYIRSHAILHRQFKEFLNELYSGTMIKTIIINFVDFK